MWPVRFIETLAFTRQLVEAMSDDEYRKLQQALLARPTQGVLIPGTRGARKIRWGSPGHGKRGSFRIIYYWHSARQVFLMLYLYSKSEQGDLTADQRRALGKVIGENLT
jgi:mRNA-degrading endonuclease RelE of RelBE toxin-antitoxin system